ncbi:MAG: hypothetical protein Athens071424_227 [Parcubacteria group bacterium Athens0714_24]|nr:MAG: hypothetical protein Athens071424_227 [Parcubacteria group bacterium Athens0714_24]
MKATIISIIFSVALIAGVIIFFGSGSGASSSPEQNNVSIVDGKQIIEISAKGGYSPRNTTAKANIPTVLRIKTQGTFDCSSALVIPSIGYRKNLPSSGETDIELPLQKTGSIIKGFCTMGMYSFKINFN